MKLSEEVHGYRFDCYEDIAVAYSPAEVEDKRSDWADRIAELEAELAAAPQKERERLALMPFQERESLFLDIVEDKRHKNALDGILADKLLD